MITSSNVVGLLQQHSKVCIASQSVKCRSLQLGTDRQSYSLVAHAMALE